jgi:hypothetical protein
MQVPSLELTHKKRITVYYFFGTWLCSILSSYWLAHFYLMKKSAKVLHYFGLDCGMLEFFKYSSHAPSSKEQLLSLPHFWSPVWSKGL